MTDGKIRKVIMDRGGVVESATPACRADLTDGWYGIHEAQSKIDTRTTCASALRTASVPPQADPESD